MLIGNVQGRFLPSPKNRLQFFPKRKWRDEFELAKSIGYNFIEFFSERIYDKENPIWNNNLLLEYKNLCKKNNLRIITFCDDYIISNDIRKSDYQNYYKKLISKCDKLGIKKLILPLYGRSNLNYKNYNEFIIPLFKLDKISKSKKIKLLIETNLDKSNLIQLFNSVNSNNLKLLFDTGNRITNPLNNYNDISSLFRIIDHIHIKDKTINNKNVIIGEGDVDFNIIFKNLKNINYNKDFTFETNKGKDPIKTSINNLKFIKKMIFKYNLV